jgi:hypothetical protein
MRMGLGIATAVVALFPAWAQSAPAQQAALWRFDNLDRIGGHATHVLGHPRLIDSPYGKAVEFNGQDDALFIDNHPLAGASEYTWEVFFRPDAGGAQAQRFFHLSEVDPATGLDTRNRMLFELRIVNNQWCLDSYAYSNGSLRTLLNCEKLHPLGQWYRVTAVFDGKTLRNYVGSELQGEGEFHLTPPGPGHASVGARIDKRDYFKGAVFEARMTPRALNPEEFLAMPATTNAPSANQK